MIINKEMQVFLKLSIHPLITLSHKIQQPAPTEQEYFVI